MMKVRFKPSNFFSSLYRYVKESSAAPKRFADRVISYLSGKTKFLDKFRPLSSESLNTMKYTIEQRFMRPASFNFIKRTPLPNFKLTPLRKTHHGMELRKLLDERKKTILSAKKYFNGFGRKKFVDIIEDIKKSKRTIDVDRRTHVLPRRILGKRTSVRKEKVLAYTVAKYNYDIVLINDSGKIPLHKNPKTFGIIRMNKHISYRGNFV